jgi:cobalt-zinc-cadmium efflux system membrane fusion protein
VKNARLLTTLGFIASLAAAAGAGLHYGRSTAPAPPAAGPASSHAPEGHDDHDEHKGEKGHEEHPGAESGAATHANEEGGHAGHGHGEAEVSDLDRPVAELFAGKCEHDIPHYTCDECRYELGVVKLDAGVVSREGKPGLVRSVPAGTASFEESVRLTGEVHVSDERTVHVASPLAGIVVGAPALAGRRVAAGDVLFEIDSHEVAEARADLLKKAAALDLATKTAEREALLFEKKISAEMEVQEARARQAEARIELDGARSRLVRLGVPPEEHPAPGSAGEAHSGRVAVRAAKGGTVLEGHANPGEYVEAGKELFVVSDLAEVWVWADLKDADLAAVSAAGKSAVALVEGPGGVAARGRVDVVSGTVSEQTRTARARIVVPNPGGALRPGTFVTVRIAAGGGSEVVAVPKVAVLADEGRPFVFVHHEGDYWVRRPVTLGRRSEDQVEIVAGLAPGQRIIADGSFLLKSDVLRSKMGAGCAD